MFALMPLFLPLMRRIRLQPPTTATPGAGAATDRPAAHVAE